MDTLPSKMYNPCQLFAKKQNYGVMVLNSESFKMDLNDFFKSIWNSAAMRHTVDGGSNHFYTVHEKMKSSNIPLLLPHLTSGDFDSIKPNVLNFLKSSSGATKILPTMDQDETDFVKGIRALNEYTTEHLIELEFVIAIAENAGRLDHIMGNINALHKADLKKGTDLFILSSDSLTWLLQPTMKNQINFDSNTTFLDKVCGIIPMDGPTRMRSSGLKWNLNNEIYRFGGMISTSNKIAEQMVYIELDDNPALFTVEMNPSDFKLASTTDLEKCDV